MESIETIDGSVDDVEAKCEITLISKRLWSTLN